MGPGFNNPTKIEYLIETMDEHIKALEKILSEISDLVNQFDKEQDKFIHNITIAQPINAREISSYVESANESAESLANVISKEKVEAQLDEYRQNLKALKEYYLNQYIKTVEDNK